jgi:hypothetical protein
VKYNTIQYNTIRIKLSGTIILEGPISLLLRERTIITRSDRFIKPQHLQHASELTTVTTVKATKSTMQAHFILTSEYQIQMFMPLYLYIAR